MRKKERWDDRGREGEREKNEGVRRTCSMTSILCNFVHPIKKAIERRHSVTIGRGREEEREHN